MTNEIVFKNSFHINLLEDESYFNFFKIPQKFDIDKNHLKSRFEAYEKAIDVEDLWQRSIERRKIYPDGMFVYKN
jgi:hypothetical protein